VRFNHGRVRQAGSVTQAHVSLDLIEGRRHASGTLTLSGEANTDAGRAEAMIERLREWRAHIPEDPYLLLPDEVHSTETVQPDRLPEAGAAVEAIVGAARGLDLVGFFAAGPVHTGYADSRGQRNWHTVHTFSFDWSVYLEADRAVKAAFAGTEWSDAALVTRLEENRRVLEGLRRPPVRIRPGGYRVHLAPEALYEIVWALAWGGFSLRSHRTKTTPLLRMIEEGARLHPSVTVSEVTTDGLTPAFQEGGFIRPERVVLIDGGRYRDCLVSPRSTAEYGVPCNGGSSFEAPQSLEVATGNLDGDGLARLGDGIAVSNLHYLNYSDRPACRLTGLTRFATFRVRGGEIEGPLEVMRFDDTIYRMLGDNLVGFTAHRERILDTGTYGRRSTDSAIVPGALVEDFRFAL
jgi:predicted Zn-dependent protease